MPAKKLYLAACAFRYDDEDGNRMGTFQYLLNASSPEEFETLLKEQLATLVERSKESEAFKPGTQIWVDNILEIESIPAPWQEPKVWSSISTVLPCEEPDEVATYAIGDEEPADGPFEPFVTLRAA